MKVKYILSLVMVLVCLFNAFSVNTYATSVNELSSKEKTVLSGFVTPSDDIILPQSYVHMLETSINGSDYTKIESSGNYARSNAIKVEYNSTKSGANKTVHFMIVEHMAFTADEVYEFNLSVGQSKIIHLTKTGNNFTIKAMLVNIGTETITTTTSLYRDITV